MNVELGTRERSIFASGSPTRRTRTAFDRRIGLAIRFIPPGAPQVRRTTASPLVRGVDTHGHFELEPEPRVRFDPNAVEFHLWAEEEAGGSLQGTNGKRTGT